MRPNEVGELAPLGTHPSAGHGAAEREPGNAIFVIMKCPSLLWCIALVFASFNALAQTDIDSLLDRKVPDCKDVSINAGIMVVRTMASGEADSTTQVLQSWRRKCPDSESAFRTEVLLRMNNDSSVLEMIDADAFGGLWSYQWLSSFPREALMAEAPQFVQYADFTRKWAQDLLPKYSPGMLEYDLCKTYGIEPNHLFEELQKPNYPAAKLQARYKEEVAKYTEIAELHASLFIGIWLPTGDLSPLGTHPLFGFQMGGKKKRFNYDLTIAFATGASADPYTAKRNEDADTTESTSHYFGGHGSIDFGLDILQQRANEVRLEFGVGFEGFDAFKTDNDEKDRSGSTFVLDLSPGVSYRRYLTPWSYVGIQMKYHFVDYAKADIVDMSGKPVTLRLIYGGLVNYRKRAGIEALRYKYRR